MIYGIASYKRPACRTVRTLVDAGIDCHDIIVSTQTEDDYAAYKSSLPCEVVFQPKDSAAGNRNTILDYVKAPVLLLDDDISAFEKFADGKWAKDTVGVLERIKDMFDLVQENKGSLFGVSANTNGIITRGRYEFDLNTLLQGTVLGVIDSDIRFNEKWKMVEDYELSLRLMRKGRRLIRANYLCAAKPRNGTNVGGLHDRYASGELKMWISALSRSYPEFKPNKKMDGGTIVR